MVAGNGKSQNRDGKGKFKGQNYYGKGKFTSLLSEPTPRTARSPPSAPPVNTFASSLDVDVERFKNGQSLGVLLARGSARTHASSRLSCPGAADVSASVWEAECRFNRRFNRQLSNL
jgi:hypothetical protein